MTEPPVEDSHGQGFDPWAPPGEPAPDPTVPAIGPSDVGHPPAGGAAGAVPPPLVGPPPSVGSAVPDPAYVASGGPRRAPGRTVAVAAAVVLALVAGVFGIVQVTAADGAGSPEGAVEALFDAIDREDVLGMVEALAPNERDLLLPLVRDLGAEAERLEVSEDLDLAGVQGVDLEVTGLELEVEELAPGVADVRIVGGTLTGSARLADLPAGAIFEDLIAEGDAEAERPDTESLAGIRLVARRSDGWHVSLLSSLAEEARRSLDPVPAYPSPDDAIAAVGAESPEGAVREAVAAAIDLDVRRLIELTPPDEMAVLHEYGSILVEQAAEDRSEPPEVEIEELELTTTDGPDGSRVVRATTVRIVATSEGETTTYDVRDGCATTRWESTWGGAGDDTSSEFSSCDDDGPLLGLGGIFSAGEVGSLAAVTVERGGAWYLSPTRTLAESILEGVRALTVEDVERYARFLEGELWVMEPDDFWEACGVDRPALDAPDDEAEAAYAQCWEDLPDDYAGWTWGWDPAYDHGWDEGILEFDDDPSWACYDLDTDAETLACLQDLADRGEIDPEEVLDHVCGQAWAALDEDATDEEWDAADERYEACMDSGGKLPTDTTPPGTTTAPSSPSTTTPSSPSTTRPSAPSTSVPVTPSTVPPPDAPGD